MLMTYFVNFRKLNDHLFGKELFIRFTASAFRKLPSIYLYSYFPFGFEGRIWDLIVSVPNHCLSFYFFCDDRSQSLFSSLMFYIVQWWQVTETFLKSYILYVSVMAGHRAFSRVLYFVWFSNGRSQSLFSSLMFCMIQRMQVTEPSLKSYVFYCSVMASHSIFSSLMFCLVLWWHVTEPFLEFYVLYGSVMTCHRAFSQVLCFVWFSDGRSQSLFSNLMFCMVQW